jgi:hypothetical protein
VRADLAQLVECAFHDPWVFRVQPLKHPVERRRRFALQAHLPLAT